MSILFNIYKIKQHNVILDLFNNHVSLRIIAYYAALMVYSPTVILASQIFLMTMLFIVYYDLRF